MGKPRALIVLLAVCLAVVAAVHAASNGTVETTAGTMVFEQAVSPQRERRLS